MRWLIPILMTAGTMLAQPPRASFPWWESPLAGSLNLTDAQRKEIRATVSEYRDRLVDLRATIQKAEGDLEDAFNEDTVDQRKASEIIDRLANARGELTRTISQMSLKLRMVLTAEQWQELQKRQQERQRQRGPGLRRRGRGSPDRAPSPPEAPPAKPPADF
jgi:Spy/CpxP family protein refolding chaperone